MFNVIVGALAKIFYREGFCIGKINSLYAASIKVFREWSNLATPLKDFEDWFTAHSS